MLESVLATVVRLTIKVFSFSFTGYGVCRYNGGGFSSKIKKGILRGTPSVIDIKIPVGSKIMDAQVVYEASKNKLTYIAIENFGGSSCPPKWAGIIGK